MTLALSNKISAILSFSALGVFSACGGRGGDDFDPSNSDGASQCIGCDIGGRGASSNGDGDDGGTSGDGDMPGDGDGDNGTGAGPNFGDIGFGEFKLHAEWDGPCEEASGRVDINLGNTAETAVRSIHCQIYGEEPSPTVLSAWAGDLTNWEHVRRVDLAWTFCLDAGRACDLSFSDPWERQIQLEETCTRNDAGDIGAVMMFFSDCPGGINCGQYWANTHSVGMESQHALLAHDSIAAGFYNPKNVGWWRREFLDARWAGLSFLMLNSYGPDVVSADQPIQKAVQALDSIDGGIGLALMDDTWGWRDGQEGPYGQVPSLDDTEGAAQHIYTHKWKAFFDRVPDKHRYKFKGRPVIYFYNAGTLHPREAAPGVIERMKELFEADYGVLPFVIVDGAFFANEAAMNTVADGRFTWDSFKYPGNDRNTMRDVTVVSRMPRWDPVGRDRGASVATAGDNIHKGPDVLEDVLTNDSDADITILHTWNDLGEGTGIHRNYDYFHEGQWLAPHHFMSMIRQSRCE